MGVTSVFSNTFRKVIGNRNDRLLKKLTLFADTVEDCEQDVAGLDDDALRARTADLKRRFADGATEDELLPEAFAVLREASRRAQAHRQFHCQLIGGKVLNDGMVAEMKTGEGKTIVCHLAAYMQVVQGNHVHIVTVNDYLVRRDAEFAAPIFAMLDVTVGYIQSQVDPGGAEGIRRKAYACDLTYGTNSEFGFDYLRDNMKMQRAAQVQSSLDYAIIDEVDSILIDEARTPLIISGPAHDDVDKYRWADHLARLLVRKQKELDAKSRTRIAAWGDKPPAGYAQNPKFEGALQRFMVDPKMLTEEEAEALGHQQLFVVQLERKSVSLTHDGIQVAQDEAKIGSFYIGQNMDRPHLIEQALRAHVVYERDKEYVVQDRQVIIVDEFTGRLMHGRQWSDGLHQAVEAKEGVPIKEETQTMATITIQNFCKLYGKLAGMTGTAMTEANEFMKIYKLDVVAIPTNRPINRLDHNDKVYRTVDHKYQAIVDEIHEMRRRGRPADPFLLADVLKAIKPINSRLGKDTSKIDAAIKAFNDASEADSTLLRTMADAYDDAVGDLATGRPVLVGTTSVENSEKLSNLLERTYGIEHEVLNAKNHAREAEIVAKAGHRSVPTRGADKTPVGNVTIATNMAGRGTDIKLEDGVVYPKCKVTKENLDGDEATPLYPIGSTKCCIDCAEYDPATNCAHCFKPRLDPRFPELGRKVCAINAPCGLHIIGTERHESRRIDNQLRGRAGRQGDPGSSRFFLSLEDDLLKLFMPDWMLKMMEKLGFTEGTSLEDKRLSKGIERAQRKVEERNFGSRKHLLEWDEPMDFQRKEFYSARQRILEGAELRESIITIIREAVEDAVDRFLARDYRSLCISEWCRANLDVLIDPEHLMATDLDELQADIRRRAVNEARETITTSIGEYVDPELDPQEWDIRGLSEWAQRWFKINTTQNQLRRMSADEISDFLLDAATKHFEGVDLSGVAVFLDEDYPRAMLVDWCRSKFDLDLSGDRLAGLPRDEVVVLIMDSVHDKYREREIRYPVEVAIERSGLADAGADSTYSTAALAQWVGAKYRIDKKPEDYQDRTVGEIYDELVDLNRDYLANGKIEEEVDAAIRDKSEDEAIEWARQRFGPAYNPGRFEQCPGDLRERLIDQGREMLRYELSRLEQVVLLRIHDQCWKDHLLEMDHLKVAIMQRPMGGDQTHPQSQYAIEGRDLFRQMWARVRDRVVELVFKVRMGGGPASAEAGPAMSLGTSMTMHHGDATGSGFSAAAAQQRAAMRAQGTDGKVETIRRQQPKVGRNDPCPCGSGKKYKQCHGRQ